MSALLSRGPLPLWAYILIISVGSVITLTILAVSIRCSILARRNREEADPSLSAELPTRQVTLRRGRLVPASHYQSLTGSQFGFNQFNDLEVASTIDGQKSRSRSPFEWWKTINAQSRLEAPTVASVADDPLTSSSEKTRQQHQDPLRSTPSKPTQRIMTAPNHVSNQILYPPPTTPRPTRQTNFSTPFDSRCNSMYRSPLLSRSTTSSLPQIIETSPHQSMIAHQSVLSLATQSQSPNSPALAGISDDNNNNSKISLNNVEPAEDTDSLSMPRTPTSPGFPLRAAEKRRSSGPGPEKKKPSSYRKPELETSSNRPRSLASIAEADLASATPGLPESRASMNLKPARTRSGKGNVLRKKSLRKAEMVSEWA